MDLTDEIKDIMADGDQAVVRFSGEGIARSVLDWVFDHPHLLLFGLAAILIAKCAL